MATRESLGPAETEALFVRALQIGVAGGTYELPGIVGGALGLAFTLAFAFALPFTLPFALILWASGIDGGIRVSA